MKAFRGNNVIGLALLINAVIVVSLVFKCHYAYELFGSGYFGKWIAALVAIWGLIIMPAWIINNLPSDI